MNITERHSPNTLRAWVLLFNAGCWAAIVAWLL